MPEALVECIPNYSEARRPEVVDQIVAAIESVKGVRVLDRHSDLDHNRTVITLVGEPAAVEEAAFRSIKKAAELINLDEHRGAHPRLGATDVVPFVPISGIDMEECVALARHLGRRVGEELSIPVFLYEEAANKPERQNLENVRRGQYEGLKDDIAANPERNPDFGPAKLGTAGATIIGARAPLIAFNVYLTSDDLSLAQKIARAVRASSGGFSYLKAMGVMVEGRAQVSMNMTNFRQTPLARVVEAVRREAERYGVGIHHSELVGLIPQDALIDAAVWYTQLDGFKSDQILETRLYEGVSQTEERVMVFLEQLASANPTPGGGSAAAHAGACAAALVSMVVRVTLGKKKFEDVHDTMQTILTQSEGLREDLSRAVQDDATSFEDYLRAIRLPKETAGQQAIREDAIHKATLHAAQVPLRTCELCLAVLKLAQSAAKNGNPNAISDAYTAASMAAAALRSAAANVKINLRGLSTLERAGEMIQRVNVLLGESAQLEVNMQQIFDEHLQIG